MRLLITVLFRVLLNELCEEDKMHTWKLPGPRKNEGIIELDDDDDFDMKYASVSTGSSVTASTCSFSYKATKYIEPDAQAGVQRMLFSIYLWLYAMLLNDWLVAFRKDFF